MKKPAAYRSLTRDQVAEMLAYDPDTGSLTWKVTRGRCVAGKEAGALNVRFGCRQLGLGGGFVYAHQVAWLLSYGYWPETDIDHINGDRADNRLSNLRECTHAQNAKNMKMHRDNSSGFKGAYYNRTQRQWISQIMVDGRIHYLGTFRSAEECAAAYDAASRRLHGEFARPNGA